MEEQKEHFHGYRPIDPDELQDIADRILFEDNHLLIINKRVGEIVQGDKTGDEPLSETLKAFIAQRDGKPGRVFIGVPHRLDRPVSGIAVFAKTSKCLERMNEMFRDGAGQDSEVGSVDGPKSSSDAVPAPLSGGRRIKKTYWALVEKCPEPKSGELHHYLLRNESQNKSYPYDRPRVGAKEARLRYHLLKATKNYFLVEVELLTGRHHQIRCQLSAIGCPIKGDLKYGARRSNKDGGISLHARTIEMLHPVKKTMISVTAPTEMENM